MLTGGIPVFLSPTRNRYGIIGPIPPSQLAPKAIAKGDRRESAGEEGRPQASGLRRAHELHLRRDVLSRRRRRGAARDRAWTGSTSTKRGTATRASIRCTATASPCGAIRRTTRPTARRCSPPTRPTSCSRRSRRPRTSTSATAAGAIDHGRFNEAYCTQASTSPLYALIASNDVAAAMMDGPAGQAITQEVIDEAIACRLAVARVQREFAGQEGVVLRAVERGGGPRSEDRQADPVPRSARRAAGHRSRVLGAASGRELARLRGRPRKLVHARSDQVRHRVSGHERRWRAGCRRAFRPTS